MFSEEQISQRRGCALVARHHSTIRYVPSGRDDTELMEQLKEVARSYKRYGYRRAGIVLRQWGFVVNQKRVHRVWKEAGLQCPRKVRRRRSKAKGQVPLTARYPDHVWTYDFMHDATSDGRTLRVLAIVDDFTRRSIEIEVERRMPAVAVIKVLERAFARCGTPAYLRSDNGSEFVAEAVKRWLEELAIRTHYIDPGASWQNAYGESFNGKLRDECLNMESFTTVREAQFILRQWRDYYNNQRPHSSLYYLTPNQFNEQWRKQCDGSSRAQDSVSLSLTHCELTGRNEEKQAGTRPSANPSAVLMAGGRALPTR
jgi:transposase InsO family protein